MMDFSAGWGLWCFTYYFKVTVGQMHFSEVTRKRTGKWGWEERGRWTLGSSLLVTSIAFCLTCHGAHEGHKCFSCRDAHRGWVLDNSQADMTFSV